MGASRSVICEVVDKCFSEISESPESVSALLATNLISAIMGLPSTRSLHEQILRSFLIDKIVDPLIEGEDHFMHEGDSHPGGCCSSGNKQEAKQGSYMQIVCNIADKLAEASPR